MSNSTNETPESTGHKKKMQKFKTYIDAGIAKATTERGIVILLTGNGKGKSSSAFGMVMRSLGYDYKVGIIQFIKGAQKTGEELYIIKNHPEVFFHQMNTGFTWNTQDKEGDIAAAEKTWAQAEKALKDPETHLLLLDELTYMFTYGYLNKERVINAIKNRPRDQTVVITGRSAHSSLIEMADTVSEIKDEKHAFHAGIMARKGVDF